VVVLHQAFEGQCLQIGRDQLVVGIACALAIKIDVRQAELDVQIVELLFGLLAGPEVHPPAPQVALVAQVGEHRT
jgi:hypothetical protein